jgi:hypothetical protein
MRRRGDAGLFGGKGVLYGGAVHGAFRASGIYRENKERFAELMRCRDCASSLCAFASGKACLLGASDACT